MKFLPLPLCVLALWLSSMAFSQSETKKPAPRAGQAAKEIILIGEMHGTQETPRLFSNLVTLAARDEKKRIGVGLELPIPLQRLLDEAVKTRLPKGPRFASESLNADTASGSGFSNLTHYRPGSFREQLLAHPAWQKINDGRSSEAMLDLICDTLRLAERQKVSLFFFDTETADREEDMAQLIGRRAREQGYDVTFILTGNIHANKAPRHPLNKKIVPMGHRLEEQGFTVHSYDVGYSEGETWMCTRTECGVHHLKGWRTAADPDAIHGEGYDAVLFVGPIHASPPAHGSVSVKEAQ